MFEKNIIGNALPTDIDFGAIRSKLKLQLSLHPSSAAREIRDLLVGEPVCTDPMAAAAEAQTMLADVASEHVGLLKARACARIHDEYPGENGGAPDLESPKKYIGRNGLDSSLRPSLRQARNETVAESRARITEAIKADDYHLECGIGVSDEELQQSAEEHRDHHVQTLHTAVDAVKKIKPERVDPHNGMGKLVLRALGADPRDLRPMFRTTPELYRELGATILHLRNTLNRLMQDPSTVAGRIQEEFEPAVKAYLDELLTQRYAELEAAERAKLPQELQTAYGQAVSAGSWHKPKTTCQNGRPETNGKPETNGRVKLPAQALPVAEMVTDEEKALGEVENPFPWSEDPTVQISLFRNNGDTLLVCTAMSPIAGEISELLRTQQQHADEFNNFWQRVKEIESSGNALTHGHIRITKHVYNDAYQGFSLLRYGNRSHNAKRLYYVKVTADQSPDIRDLAGDHGIDPSTPLLVRIAETDKAHQLKLYGDLGMHRREAKQGRVGSI